MGYDTRRKSLYLPDLGIDLPQSHASKAAARLSPLSTATSTSEHQYSKKLKRSRGNSCSWSPPPKRVQIKCEMASPPPEVHDIKVEVNVKQENVKVEDVKPRQIDWDGIKDEIVEAVIRQLQKTNNRPHLVKELAAILSQSVKIVDQSANQSAIISSRLSQYLKRSWTASSPCPVGKELETVHPRRTYFYLTTYPHQPIPDPSQFPQRTIISPSISSADSRSDGTEEIERLRCDSPEVDLSSEEEYDDDVSITPPTPTGSLPGRLERPVRNNRASSVGLEKDEREFTQTARGMQTRNFNSITPLDMAKPSELDTAKPEESDPFLEASRRPNVSVAAAFMNSPAMKPVAVDYDTRSPETIELDELDGLLDGYC